MIPLSGLKFGTDAEIFLRTMEGSPFPVTGLIGGSKEHPIPIPGLVEGFTMQEDNAALEFNIPPTGSISLFRDWVEQSLTMLSTVLPKTVQMDRSSCVMDFNEHYLDLPELRRFGCEPDYNAWTLETNERPQPPSPGFRTASAHVHLGWTAPNDEDRLEIIRLADVFVTLPHLKDEGELEVKRRQLYGRAGAFRPKEYGVEHRVLGNSWAFHRSKVKATLRNYLRAITALNANVKVDLADYGEIVTAINTHDLQLAEAYHTKYFTRLNEAMGQFYNWEQLWELFA